jgi:hypothetical protein
MFGLVRECTREVSKVLLAGEAVVTASSWHRHRASTTAGAVAWRRRDLLETMSAVHARGFAERRRGGH